MGWVGAMSLSGMQQILGCTIVTPRTTSEALAINDRAQVTGFAKTATGAVRAFLWPTSGSLLDLGTLDGMNSRGTAINASGQITGSADTAAGTTHAFLLEPVALARGEPEQ